MGPHFVPPSECAGPEVETRSKDKLKISTEETDLQRWYRVSYSALEEYANQVMQDANLSVERFEQVMKSIADELPDCPAKCPAQMRQWARKRIDKKVAKFSLRYDAGKHPRKNEKPLLYEVHNDRAFVKLTDAAGEIVVWILPAKLLDTVRRLWPVHIRHLKDGRPYVAKKTPYIGRDGEKTQKLIALHRVIVDCEEGQEVEALDGNFLNWTEGNLRAVQPTGSTDILDKAQERRTDRALPRRSNGNIEHLHDCRDDYMQPPAKPVRPKGAAADEEEDWPETNYARRSNLVIDQNSQMLFFQN